MTEHALIIGAAPVPGAERFYRELLERFHVLIACDAAAEWCMRLGCPPSYAVGDFDSARPGALERLRAAGIEVLAYPRDKDETDLDLAAAHAESLRAASLTFTAAFSGRLDHTLAAIGTLRRFSGLAPIVLEPGFTAWLLSERARPALAFECEPGTLFSVLAIDPIVGLSVNGARYPAHDLDVGTLSSATISNEAAGRRVQVRLRQGTALVMLMHSSDNAL